MILNLRELGGYRGQDGLRIKEGLLYRSGNLNLPDDRLAGELNRLDISLVFDLRSQDELDNEPYVLPGSVLYRHRPVLLSLEEDMRAINQELYFNNPAAAIEQKDLSLEALDLLLAFMPRIYRTMGQEAAIFGDIIREILEEKEAPLLFHCSAGKDRTGILASMILLALGVSESDVRDHYMLSNDYRQEAIVQEREAIRARVKDPQLLEKIEPMLVVKEEYLDATLQAVRDYPSFETYAQERMGLGPHHLQALRDRYLAS